MKNVALSTAKKTFETLFDRVAEGKPVCICGKDREVVLVSREEWHSLLETMHLLSIKGMRESIVDGMQAPADECSEDPGW